MKNQSKLIILFLFIILLSGCTKVLKDENNKRVLYKETGQALSENIICQPTNPKVIKIYEKNKVNISDLPKCNSFNLKTAKYEGIWTSFFVKPLAWVILKIGKIVKNHGVALIIVSLLIRLILYPVIKGTVKQTEKIKEAQPELNRIEKKYKDKTNQEDIMKKSQEIMLVYKKHAINPLAGCVFGFIQLPLFLAFLEAIYLTPALFEGKLLFLQLGTTPFVGIKNGQFQYLILVVLLVLVTYLAFKFNKNAAINAESQKQMEMVSKIMIVFIVIASFNFSTAISLYWIASNLFTIIQNKLG